MANRSLIVGAALGCLLGSGALLPAGAVAQCQLCASEEAAVAAAKPAQRPIVITIEAGVDFSRIALVRTGLGGTATIDPSSGQRTLTGNLIGLSGVPVSGTVTIRGEPKQHVEVSFPTNALLYNSTGASYPLVNFRTTLKNNPKIGDDGTLRFTFGGTLQINGSAAGNFRGSIPVTVEYR
jgi:hypothetical protein